MITRDDTGRGVNAIIGRLGPDAVDPLTNFCLALGYEQTHVPSLQGFLHWLASPSLR